MPSTLGGLLIFVAFLVPGFLYFIQRRRLVPQKSVSTLVETATFTTVSLATNLVTAGLFAILRVFLPTHTPDLGKAILQGKAYVAPHLGYLLAWATGILFVSSSLALLLALGPQRVRRLPKWLTPDIVQASAWYRVMNDEVPPGCQTFVGCDLRDGSYVSGFVDWFNTDVDEVAERDLALASPITVIRDGKSQTVEFPRLVISARDVVRLYVSYPENEASEVSEGAHPLAIEVETAESSAAPGDRPEVAS